jgi:hypothetical protein
MSNMAANIANIMTNTTTTTNNIYIHTIKITTNIHIITTIKTLNIFIPSSCITNFANHNSNVTTYTLVRLSWWYGSTYTRSTFYRMATINTNPAYIHNQQPRTFFLFLIR